MNYPSILSALSIRLGFLGYVHARLVRARHLDLTPPLLASRADMKATAADVQSLEEAQQEAIAIRDAVGDDLDDVARGSKAALAGRSADAVREGPCTDVFPKGIAYYVDVNLDERPTRFRELASRLEEHLPEADPVRANAAVVRAHLEAWRVATEAVADARDALARGRTRRDKASHAFVDAVTAIYGALLAREGKAKARRFFPPAKHNRRSELEGAAVQTRGAPLPAADAGPAVDAIDSDADPDDLDPDLDPDAPDALSD